MQQVWANFRHDFRTQWRVFLALFGLMLAATHASTAAMPQGSDVTLLAVALTALVLAGPLYLVYLMPLFWFRNMFLGAMIVIAAFWAATSVLRAAGQGHLLDHWAIALGFYVAVFLIFLVPVPLPFRARRIYRPNNAAVFGDDTAAEHLFSRLRPRHEARFPDPMLGPALVTEDGAFLVPVRGDVTGSLGDQKIWLMHEASPTDLALRIEMSPGKRRTALLIRQRWHLTPLEDGSVEVRHWQTANWGLLTGLIMYLGDAIGDWLDSVLARVNGDEMRSFYGRTIDARIARAMRKAARDGQWTAPGGDDINGTK